ncbi:MAG TPA: UDP-N-acetylglucosamine 2-epimerase (non-hydrolyzing) [Bryobacteraceae bacterium]|nr:UDP-N-acetylglucosamine 2-epimerase (non-hydrolyzing) [Bryobacteraceae bacterium]
MRLLVIAGTRPEAIKLCPVILAARERESTEIRVCVTAQHRELLDEVLVAFSVRSDYDLDIMQPGQTLFRTTARIVEALEGVLADASPDMVLVQGDTTTTMAGALAAFYARIPVAHVEAGLRTGDPARPFPEEMNRVLTGRLATLHFAATSWAAGNLHREGVDPGKILVTGNTGIDALLYVRDRLERGQLSPARPVAELDPRRKLLVVTAHRRESFGEGMAAIARALRTLAARSDVQIVFPVHPNPQVRSVMRRELADIPHLHLIEPLDYVSFVDLMRKAHVLITDSGGVQEEAPSLGKPVLVLREQTERPEAVDAGTAVLVGTDEARIVQETERLLNNEALYRERAYLHNPYGDGSASERILDRIAEFLPR